MDLRPCDEKANSLKAMERIHQIFNKTTNLRTDVVSIIVWMKISEINKPTVRNQQDSILSEILERQIPIYESSVNG